MWTLAAALPHPSPLTAAEAKAGPHPREQAPCAAGVTLRPGRGRVVVACAACCFHRAPPCSAGSYAATSTKLAHVAHHMHRCFYARPPVPDAALRRDPEAGPLVPECPANVSEQGMLSNTSPSTAAALNSTRHLATAASSVFVRHAPGYSHWYRSPRRSSVSTKANWGVGSSGDS